MGTLGDLTGGYIEGRDAWDRWAGNKQLRRAREQGLEVGENELESVRQRRKAAEGAYGLDPQEPYQETEFPDPVKLTLGKIWSGVQNIWGGGQQAQPEQGIPAQQPQQAPQPVQAISPQMSQAPNAGPQGIVPQTYQNREMTQQATLRMADGGEVDEDKRIREEARRRRERLRAKPGESATRPPPDQTVDTTQPKPKPEKPSRMSRVKGAARGVGRLARGVARGTPAASGIIAAGKGGQTATEEYSERIGILDGKGFWQDLGIRALGVLGDLGNTVTFGMAGEAGEAISDYMYGGGGEGEQPATEPAIPAPDSPEQTAPAAAGPSQAGAAPPAQESAIPAPQGPQQSPVPQQTARPVSRDGLPQISTADWSKYRGELVRAAINEGVSVEEAEERVDSTITGMQHRGFLRGLQETLNLMQAGDMENATKALYTAYQYFPNGSNVSFGVRGNSIVGMGYDEETGERKGQGMALTPERVAVMIENFKNPSAFRMWTKDWRDDLQAERKYEEVEKPAAQSRMTYEDRAGRAALNRSQADLMDAAGMGRSGANVKESDYRASQEAVMENLFNSLPGADQTDLDAMAAMAAQIRRKYPSQSQITDTEIANRLARAYQEQDLTSIRSLLEE